MFRFTFKNKSTKNRYKVTYVSTCRCDYKNVGSLEFDKSNILEMYVRATDVIQAGVEFAKNHVLSPNICICRIDKVNNVESK
jgi:hypothetical protein